MVRFSTRKLGHGLMQHGNCKNTVNIEQASSSNRNKKWNFLGLSPSGKWWRLCRNHFEPSFVYVAWCWAKKTPWLASEHWGHLAPWRSGSQRTRPWGPKNYAQFVLGAGNQQQHFEISRLGPEIAVLNFSNQGLIYDFQKLIRASNSIFTFFQ